MINIISQPLRCSGDAMPASRRMIRKHYQHQIVVGWTVTESFQMLTVGEGGIFRIQTEWLVKDY